VPILLGVSVFWYVSLTISARANADSIFSLANQNSLLFTNIFGGSNANEGLGVLSLCFNMQYISTTGLWYPFPTQVNLFIGYVCGILLVT
jgi:OPT oligopeptide transporter protein